MIKVSVIYPRSEGSHFDADYYAQKHLPMAKEMFGDLCQRVELQVAVSDSQPFHAVGEMVFESVDAMKQAFKPNIKALQEDLINYSNVTPVQQMSVLTEI